MGGRKIAPSQVNDGETDRWHKFQIELLPFDVVIARDPDDPDAEDDELVLTGETHDGETFRRVITLRDRTHVTKISDQETRVRFPHVPNGTYTLFFDLKRDAAGQKEGGYYVFRDAKIPRVEDPPPSDDEPYEHDVDPGSFTVPDDVPEFDLFDGWGNEFDGLGVDDTDDDGDDT